MKKSKEQKQKEFLVFRAEKLDELRRGKISSEDFSNFMFGYLIQNRIKPIPKANELFEIIFNYYYWLTQVERKCVKEKLLIKENLGSEADYIRVSTVFLKRRDSMVRRLIDRQNWEVLDKNLVFGTTLEISFKQAPDTVFYCSKDIFSDEVYFPMTHSRYIFYLNILNINKL